MLLIRNETISRGISRVALFLVLFLSAGFWVTNDLVSSFFTKALWLALLITLLFSVKHFSKNQFLFFLSTNTIIILTTIINQDNIINAMYMCLAFAAVLFYSLSYSEKEFEKHYSDVMYYLSILSLLFYSIYIAFPNASTLFNVENAAGNTYSGLVVYQHSTNIDSGAYYRNMGMFWEPGAYQIFLSIACFFEIKAEILNPKRIIVFLITLFTTFSTTAYISILILMVFWVSSAKKTKAKKSFLGILILLISMCLVMYFRPELFFDKSKYTVFGKIINFFERDVDSGRVTSSTIRYNAIIQPWLLFLQRPFLGYGASRLNALTYAYTKGMNTCTFVNWFAIYGVFFGGLMLGGIYLFSKRFENKVGFSLAMIAYLFIVTMSENIVHNPIIYLLCLYGFQSIGTRGKQEL